MSAQIDLQFNYPVLQGQRAALASLLREIAANAGVDLAHRPYGGSADHREAGAGWLSRDGIEIDSTRVMLCAGAHHAVLVALLAAGLRGRKVAADALTYPGFKLQAASLGIELIACPGDAHGMMAQGLAAAAEAGASAVYLMPTVHNPLGTVMPLQRRRELCAVAEQHDLLIVDDDAYQFLEPVPPPSFAALAPDRAFSVWSFTKPVAPAVKLAYLTFPQSRAAQVTTTIRLSSSGASAFLGEIATRMVRSGELAALIGQKRAEGTRRQQLARESLEGITFSGHPNSFHFWIELPDYKNATAVTAALQTDGVLVNSSDDFVANAGVAANGMRVALGAESDLARIAQGLQRVRQRILE